jgi:hypothetical protein
MKKGMRWLSLNLSEFGQAQYGESDYFLDTRCDRHSWDMNESIVRDSAAASLLFLCVVMSVAVFYFIGLII